ncbi:MAG: type VI secretion system protein TssA [Planctomycetia bacterium]|nr:type VI secretion system protein TssA [Planctomycetia bacterium]
MSDTPNFGQLESPRPDYAATDETPLRIAVWGDFSGRSGREEPRSADELKSLRGRKAAFDDLDELIEEIGPKLAFSTSGGDEIELEFRELDDFHPDPIYKSADVFNKLEDSRDDRVNSPAALQMRELLRHSAYQLLESAWRGLALLLRRVSKDRRVQVLLFDVTAEELRSDLAAQDDLAQTAIFDLLVNKSAQAPDGIPWGMIVGLYSFGLSEEDAALVGRLAKIATYAGGPFLAGMESDVTRLDSYELPDELTAAWKALRALPEASYVALATPGFLLRPPFGDNYRPPDSIPFEEFDGRPEGYLWGNSAVACATLLALGFMESGWKMNPAAKRVLDSMPVHAYRDEHDEDVGVITEVRFTSAVGTELAKLGLIPALSFKGRDLVELAAIRSLSAEQPLLAGLWTGGGKVSFASPTEAKSDTVKLKGGPAPKSTTVRSNDPEVDDDLASLLAAGDDDDNSSSDDDDTSSDDDSSSDSDDDVSPAADDDSGSDNSDPSDDSSDSNESASSDDSDDLDLDALMASLGDDEETSSDEGTSSDAASEDSASAADDIDLDAMLASLGDDDVSESDEVKSDAGETSSADDDLAALLAGDDEGSSASNDDSSDDAPSSSGDADLDALLAGLGGSDDSDSDSSDDDNVPSSSDDATSSESETSTDDDIDLDAMLAGLGDDDAEQAKDEAAPDTTDEAAADLDLDAMLASLGDDDAEPTEDAEAEIDLDAMLAELDAGGDANAEETKMASDVSDETETAADDSANQGAAMDTQDLSAMVEATKASTKYGESKAASPAILDFLALVQPISEDEPAGDSVPFDVRQKLDEMRKEINPSDFAEDDPLRPAEPVRADWQGVIRLCQQTLTEKSKNLLIAARLTEALARVHGFAGLRDGLHLFRQLVECCWNRLEPALDEDDDLEVRAAPFNWLDDTDRGAVFPNTIRSLPVVVVGGERYGALHFQLAREGKEGLANEIVEKAVFNSTPEQCRRLADDSAQALTELKQLVNELRAKMANEAPGLSYVRGSIEEGATLAKQIVARKGGDESAADVEETVDDGAGGQTVVMRSASRAVTRDDLYKQLHDAATALQRMEPHSPVPYIIQRAVAFGSLPFPQLMQELIRDANVISEMNRELGIKSPPGEEE